jgi:chitinase
VDFICLMTYPLSGPWTGHSAHQANLYPTDLPNGDTGTGINLIIEHLIRVCRVPPRKVLLGLHFWARSYPTRHLGDVFPDRTARGMRDYPYKEIPALEKSADYRKYWDKKAMVPYLERVHGGNAVITYDDPRSLRLKMGYAKKNGLGGALVWHLGADVLEGRTTLQACLKWR